MKTYSLGRPLREALARVRPLRRAPNIMYVVIDDLTFGASDTFGGLIETPWLTRLARRGQRHLDFHTAAASTACLFSERDPIATALRPRGYASIALGKWRAADTFPDAPHFGFDRFFGFTQGEDNSCCPTWYEGRTPIDPRRVHHGYHVSEDLATRAIEWLGTHSAVEPEKPWLCYLAFGASHSPEPRSRAWLETYRGKFDFGWDEYRSQVLERQQELGVVPAHATFAPLLEGITAWEILSVDERQRLARSIEAFAASLSHTDAQLGRVTGFLERTGQLENTLLFVFAGDRSLHDHLPIGWARALDTPFEAGHSAGRNSPLVALWPSGVRSCPQLQYATDLAPAILAAVS